LFCTKLSETLSLLVFALLFFILLELFRWLLDDCRAVYCNVYMSARFIHIMFMTVIRR